jgi:NADH dehydrogenase
MRMGGGLPGQGSLRVVVAGGGFAGLYAAVYMARSELAVEGVETVLVDAKNHFTFTPLLSEVVAGSLGREHVTFPYRVLGHRSGFRFVQDRVTGLDPDARLLLTERGSISYDYLVLALGAAPRYFGISGVEEHSLPISSIDDAIAIRDRVVASHEAAVLIRDSVEQQRILTFVVVGAGPAGVEVAGEIGHLANRALPRYYPGLPPARVVLVQGADRILQGWDESLARSGPEAARLPLGSTPYRCRRIAAPSV